MLERIIWVVHDERTPQTVAELCGEMRVVPECPCLDKYSTLEQLSQQHGSSQGAYLVRDWEFIHEGMVGCDRTLGDPSGTVLVEGSDLLDSMPMLPRKFN